MARIAVVGAGYAGLGTAIALASKGHRVTCVDTDVAKVELIAKGRSPFFEKGIEREVVALKRRGRLHASTDTEAVTRESDLIFLCVGTPSREDGSLDPSQISAAVAAGRLSAVKRN